MASPPVPPVCLDDFEALARKSLVPVNYEYMRGGSRPEQTLQDNRDAFLRYRLRPRVLRDVSTVDTRTTVLGETIAFPVGIAPTAMHCLAHVDGELATAGAAGALGTVMMLSMGTTKPMDEVAAASSPSGLVWAQCQFFENRGLVPGALRRVESCGFKALVVTVDMPVHHRPAMKRISLPRGVRHCESIAELEKEAEMSVTTWDDIDWLHGVTTLPIVLKGILTGEDAREATKHHVAGIVVSNHGARNIDGTLASVDALAEVVEAVRGSGVEVYLDGGVRRGTDVLKALALGARAVFIGRPVLWGLAHNGAHGVRKVLQIIRDELRLAMALTGCSIVADVVPSLVTSAPQYAAKL